MKHYSRHEILICNFSNASRFYLFVFQRISVQNLYDFCSSRKVFNQTRDCFCLFWFWCFSLLSAQPSLVLSYIVSCERCLNNSFYTFFVWLLQKWALTQIIGVVKFSHMNKKERNIIYQTDFTNQTKCSHFELFWKISPMCK